MCTAVVYKTKDHYFGRNLDLEYSYHETVTITPRNYYFKFRNTEDMKTHYAIIGMAYVVDSYPLYYDATNEKGLSVAALNFPDNAVYQEIKDDKINVASYELIAWILSRFSSVDEVLKVAGEVNITNQSFNEELPVSPLHFMIADKKKSIVLEPMTMGLMVYDNPVNVLTNNPPFLSMLDYLSNFISLDTEEITERTLGNTSIRSGTRGLGAVGLPGDLTSPSRFVRASFIKSHITAKESKESEISAAFHVLSSVEQQRGLVKVGLSFEYTAYSAVIDMQSATYYYRTYDGCSTKSISLRTLNLDSDSLIAFDA